MGIRSQAYKIACLILCTMGYGYLAKQALVKFHNPFAVSGAAFVSALVLAFGIFMYMWYWDVTKTVKGSLLLFYAMYTVPAVMLGLAIYKSASPYITERNISGVCSLVSYGFFATSAILLGTGLGCHIMVSIVRYINSREDDDSNSGLKTSYCI